MRNGKDVISYMLKTLLLAMLLVPTIVAAGISGPSPVPPAPAFQISTSTLTLCRGVVNNVPIVVSNPGAQAMTSLQLGLIASTNIYPIGNGTVNEETVPANGTTVLHLPIFVSESTASLVSTGISINYNYYGLYSDSEIRNMSFGVETCPSPLLVTTSPIITSGRIENVTLNLSNIGSTTLNDISIKVSLSGQDAAILSSQPTRLSELAPGAKTHIEENIFVFRNASQSFPLNVSVDMYNGTSPMQLLYTIPLLSAGLINITPSSTTLSPQSPTLGSIFSVSLILTDIGTAGASAVTATPLPPPGITSYGSTSVFVGDMAVDTQVPVTLTLRTNASMKSGSYMIPVRINYLNNLRENLSTEIAVPVTFASALPSNFTNLAGTRYRSSGSILLPAIVLIVIVVGVAWYLKRRSALKHVKHATR